MMKYRKEFSSRLYPLMVFLGAAMMLPFAAAWKVETRLQEVLLTIGLNCVLFSLTVILLKREGMSWQEIGMGRSSWKSALLLFLGWWLAVTAADLAARWIAELAGFSIVINLTTDWSPELILDLIRAWVFVGFAEEVAFRGYLQNKLKAVSGRKWVGMALAAVFFGLWHIPASMVLRGTPFMAALAGALGLALFSFIFLNLPYEWTCLLPFLCLFHGWSDFPLLLTFQRPSPVGAVAGYVLLIVFAAVWLWYRRSVMCTQRDRTVPIQGERRMAQKIESLP